MKKCVTKKQNKTKNYAWISKWFPPNKLLFYLHFPTNLLKNTCTQFLPFFSYGFSGWAITTVTCFHSNQTLTVSHMVILWLFLTCLAQTTHPGAILDNCGWNPVLFLPSQKTLIQLITKSHTEHTLRILAEINHIYSLRAELTELASGIPFQSVTMPKLSSLFEEQNS